MKYSLTSTYTNTSVLDFDIKKITLCTGLQGTCRNVGKTSPNMKISREELGTKWYSTITMF